MPNTKASILLVEDEENLHETLKLNLEMEGYEVTSAFDGAAALKKISNEFFHLDESKKQSHHQNNIQQSFYY